MSDENEVTTPAEEVVPEDQKTIEEAVEEETVDPGKPVGAATIVEMETPLEQFPEHDENA